jgi:hypothetical protein
VQEATGASSHKTPYTSIVLACCISSTLTCTGESASLHYKAREQAAILSTESIPANNRSLFSTDEDRHKRKECIVQKEAARRANVLCQKDLSQPGQEKQAKQGKMDSQKHQRYRKVIRSFKPVDRVSTRLGPLSMSDTSGSPTCEGVHLGTRASP